jgi:alpha-1,2-mannosyltransferase
MVLRGFAPDHALLAPTVVWLAVTLVVAALGFTAARACWASGNDMAGVAITGLLAAVLSPIAWIQHFCWLVAVLGVLISDGRGWRRASVAATAAAVALFATTSVPTWAQGWLKQGFPVVPGRLLEDALGLTAVALMLVIYRRRQPRAGALGMGRADADIQVTTADGGITMTTGGSLQWPGARAARARARELYANEQM